MSHRRGFTLVEMLVVIAIIIAIAAMAAAFMPRVNDSQRLTRAVDNFQQWLLTAKMRAKRDGLATGIRFVQAPGDAPGTYSQFQYVQQVDPISGGFTNSLGTIGGSLLSVSAVAGMPTAVFGGVDFTIGGTPLPNQWLVQPGDYLEINGGAPYIIGQVPLASPTNTLLLGQPNPVNPWVNPPIPSQYGLKLSITQPTTGFRILRQPRILMGEEPLALPDNYAANFAAIPGSGSSLPGCNVPLATNGFYEIVFAPSGSLTASSASAPILCVSIWDTTMEPPDPNRVGIVGVNGRSGFIGAYNVSLSGNPFLFVQNARESGM